jgi:hypothetical protein
MDIAFQEMVAKADRSVHCQFSQRRWQQEDR